MKYDEIHRVMRTDCHNQSKDYDDVILGQAINIDLEGAEIKTGGKNND